jgi:Ca2+/Na+ antiporter
MALGSSAPDILLAVLETAGNLGKCPGELGASTIVGSAAFNLLVISAICIWAINPDNDTDPDRDMDTEDGVKKIYNMKVFAITCSSSLFAYVWLWIVLLDQYVAMWEGVATFVFFFILVIFAYCADKVNEAENKKVGTLLDGDDVPVIKYSAYEIYKDLLNEKKGSAPMDTASIQKRNEMKKYVKDTFNTEKIETIDFTVLK